MNISLFFKWYYLWVGVYIDRENRSIYICPIPMFGIKIDNKPPEKRKPYKPKISGILAVERFYEGDTVEFAENLEFSRKLVGKRGVVTKRWISDFIGWVNIEVTTDNRAYEFDQFTIHAIRKVYDD